MHQDTPKLQAKRLLALQATTPHNLGQAQQTIARLHGFRNWQTLLQRTTAQTTQGIRAVREQLWNDAHQLAVQYLLSDAPKPHLHQDEQTFELPAVVRLENPYYDEDGEHPALIRITEIVIVPHPTDTTRHSLACVTEEYGDDWVTIEELSDGLFWLLDEIVPPDFGLLPESEQKQLPFLVCKQDRYEVVFALSEKQARANSKWEEPDKVVLLPEETAAQL